VKQNKNIDVSCELILIFKIKFFSPLDYLLWSTHSEVMAMSIFYLRYSVKYCHRYKCWKDLLYVMID